MFSMHQPPEKMPSILTFLSCFSSTSHTLSVHCFKHLSILLSILIYSIQHLNYWFILEISISPQDASFYSKEARKTCHKTHLPLWREQNLVLLHNQSFKRNIWHKQAILLSIHSGSDVFPNFFLMFFVAPTGRDNAAHVLHDGKEFVHRVCSFFFRQTHLLIKYH